MTREWLQMAGRKDTDRTRASWIATMNCVGTIDLNSDLGEGMPASADARILKLVSSANVACGGHAGDEETMRATITEARSLRVRLGAHPSYPDRPNFGRVHIDISERELIRSIREQVQALIDVATDLGVTVEYVKPHGALYNDASHELAIADIVVACVREFDLPIMALAGTALSSRADVPIIREGFLDRAYRQDGALVPRSEPGALVTDARRVAEQALRLAPKVDSLSLHSDTPGAPDLLAAARRALTDAGYTIAAR